MKNKRIIENDIYLPVLVELMKEGKEVPLMIKGSSMAPFLVDERDTIILSKPIENLKKGEMIFYMRDTQQYVMHRIHHIDQKKQLYTIGDAQVDIEGPLNMSQVLGVVHKVIRKGKMIEKGNFWWWFFETIWIRIVPLRKYFQKGYCFMKSHLFRKG